MALDDQRKRGPRRKADVALIHSIFVLRRINKGLIVCWAVIATVAGVALYVQESHSTDALTKANSATAKANSATAKASRALAAVVVQQRRQHEQLIQNCIRGNITRVNDNVSHRADYVYDFFVVSRFLTPTKTETARQKRITNQFAGQLKKQLHAKQWTPLTDCQGSVAREGSTYRIASPVAFSKRFPPSSALSIPNARRVTPVGSLP